jgi:hypothetical protein
MEVKVNLQTQNYGQSKKEDESCVLCVERGSYYIQQAAVLALVSRCGIMTGTLYGSQYIRLGSSEGFGRASLLKGGYMSQLRRGLQVTI